MKEDGIDWSLLQESEDDRDVRDQLAPMRFCSLSRPSLSSTLFLRWMAEKVDTPTTVRGKSSVQNEEKRNSRRRHQRKG